MDSVHIGNWSRQLDSQRGAPAFFRQCPGGQTSTKTHSPIDTKTEPPPLEQPPSTGRTTPLGRKVEKPADGSCAGPSGQKDRVDHQRKHANK
ncbi:MAG: hypothetical protein NDJ19_06745 [Ramlibacter sp.]|nr:hypothetical protein [Ramlibacter sp.]